MKFWVFPVLPVALTIWSWAIEVIGSIFVPKDLEVTSDKEMLADFAEPRFVKRPPLLVRVVSPYDF